MRREMGGAGYRLGLRWVGVCFLVGCTPASYPHGLYSDGKPVTTETIAAVLRDPAYANDDELLAALKALGLTQEQAQYFVDYGVADLDESVFDESPNAGVSNPQVTVSNTTSDRTVTVTLSGFEEATGQGVVMRVAPGETKTETLPPGRYYYRATSGAEIPPIQGVDTFRTQHTYFWLYNVTGTLTPT